MPLMQAELPLPQSSANTLGLFLSDVARGFVAVGRSSLAILGLATLMGAVALAHPDWRVTATAHVRSLLNLAPAAQPDSHPATAPAPVSAPSLATEPGTSGHPPANDVNTHLAQDDKVSAKASPSNSAGRAAIADAPKLNKQQTAVASWLSRRYRVAPEPVSRIVQEAWLVGRGANLDPTLILAIMAVESSFNPFAQSKVGAQGLMQVMTQLHDKKYLPFGGTHTAFDPVTNLRVGVQVLKDCLRLAGDIPTALQYYSGAARLPNDQGYANKVLSVQTHIKEVAAGRSVALGAPLDTTPLPVRPVNQQTQQATAPVAAINVSAPVTPTPTIAPAAVAPPAVTPAIAADPAAPHATEPVQQRGSNHDGGPGSATGIAPVQEAHQPEHVRS